MGEKKLNWQNFFPLIGGRKSADTAKEKIKTKPKVRTVGTMIDPNLSNEEILEIRKQASEEIKRNNFVTLKPEYPQDLRVYEMEEIGLVIKGENIIFENGDECSPQRLKLELERCRARRNESSSLSHEEVPVITISPTRVSFEKTSLEEHSNQRDDLQGTPDDQHVNAEKQEASHSSEDHNESKRSSDVSGRRDPPSHDEGTTTTSGGKKNSWNGWVVLIALIVLAVGFILLKVLTMLDQVSGSLLVGTFGAALIAIGLFRRPKAKITPYEETDEEAQKAAGRVATEWMNRGSKKSSFSDRFSLNEKGSPEFVTGILLLIFLGVYWVVFGLQKVLGFLPAYLIPLALAVIALWFLFKHLKGWNRLLIVLLVGAFAWLFFMRQPFGNPKPHTVDIGEKERSKYVERITKLRKDSALRAEDFAAQVNTMLQDALQNQEAALRYVRDSAKRVDSTLNVALQQKDETIGKIQEENADLQSNQVLTFHPKVAIPVLIGLLIVGAIIASWFLKYPWVRYVVLGIAVLGLIWIIVWASLLDVPFRKTQQAVVPTGKSYRDSIRMQDSIDYYKQKWNDEKQKISTKNTPGITTVVDTTERDSLIQRIHYLEKELTKKESVPQKTTVPKSTKQKRKRMVTSCTPHVTTGTSRRVLKRRNTNPGAILKDGNMFSRPGMYNQNVGRVLKN